jgi:hypothetical protein
MCNIWVILRRNVMYLYGKNLILINFSLWMFPYMMSSGGFLVRNKGKLICNSLNDVISGNFDSEKVDQDEIFLF